MTNIGCAIYETYMALAYGEETAPAGMCEGAWQALSICGIGGLARKARF